jgi:CrcB protein
VSPSILFSVAFGGAIGALTRFVITEIISSRTQSVWPWGTLVVNIIGAFLIGVLFVVFAEKMILPDVWRTLLVAGFLGSLTTFSTFSLELFNLISTGQLQVALFYLAVSVLSCLLMVCAGVYLARLF